MAAIILIALVIVFTALFSVQNAMPVAISFLFWRFDGSLAVIALLFFVAGMISGISALWWIRIRRKMEESRKQPYSEKPSVQ